MNILPKKSWHVRTKKNIERVRRDEAKAAEEEKEIERRKALAESEARTELLRIKARKRAREDDEVGDQTALQPTGHINFFQDEEEGIKKSGTNAEHEAEKLAEKEKQEKAIGLLTYLGQSAIELQNEKPWYFKPPEKRAKFEVSQECTSLTKKKEEFDLKHKWSEDPMKMMIKQLDTRQKVIERDKGSHSHNVAQTSALCIQQVVLSQSRESSVSHSKANPVSLLIQEKHSNKYEKKKKKKKKEHKHKRKHKHKKKKQCYHSSDVSSENSVELSSLALIKTGVTSAGRSVEQLRAERIRREREERAKREQLLAKLNGNVPEKEEELPDERKQRYNSQFNPELVRKKKLKH